MAKEKAIISDGLSSVVSSSELELGNDKNLTQYLTQNLTQKQQRTHDLT
jgi:hypothetical protein